MKIFSILLVVVAGYFGLPVSSSAQSTDNLRFERLTIENGLASNWVTDITQDSSGYIWIGTVSGLSRFDGYDFITFRNIPGNPRSLANNRVNVVFIDASGTLWVGTQTGLSRYHQETDDFLNWYHEPGKRGSLPETLSVIYMRLHREYYGLEPIRDWLN